MNFTVYTGIDPEENIKELLNRTPLRTGGVVVAVPEKLCVGRMQRRLATTEGSAYLGARVMTLEGIVLDILSFAGRSQQIAGDNIKRLILSKILKNIPENFSFRSIAAYHGFVNLLASYLQEIRSRQMSPQENELSFIAAIYERNLRTLNMNDYEGIVSLALEGDIIESYVNSRGSTFIMEGFYDLTELQFMLVRRLCSAFSISAASMAYEQSQPSLFAVPKKLLSRYRDMGAKIVQVESAHRTMPDRVMYSFGTGGDYPKEAVKDKIQIHMFRTPVSEADWIAGTIMEMIAEGINPSDIMVVTRFSNSDTQLMTAMNRHRIPLEGGYQYSLGRHPVIRLISDAPDFCISPGDEKAFETVTNSPYTFYNLMGDADNSRDEKAWSCMIADTDTPEGFSSSIRKVLQNLKVREAILSLTDKNRKADELCAYEKFLEALDEFTAVYSRFRKMSRAEEFIHEFGEFVNGVMLKNNNSANGVLLTDVNHARYLQRKIVYMTGMDDSSFPSQGTVNFIYPKKMSSEIRERHALEEPLLFYLAAQGAEKLIFTFPALDNENKDNALSFYLREIKNGMKHLIEPALHKAVPGAAWEGKSTSERARGEKALRALKEDFTAAPSILAGIRKSDPFFYEVLSEAVSKWIINSERKSIDLTSHPDWDPADGKDKTYSITELERYIQCPVEYYFLYILKLCLKQPDTDYISSMDQGSIIHKILAEFYSKRIEMYGSARFDRSEIKKNKALMKDVVEECFRQNDKLKKLPPLVLISEKKFIREWMEAFVENEAATMENSAYEPAMFEMEFRYGGSNPYLQSARGEGIISIKGRIDRIDIDKSAEPGCFKVIDYKSGKPVTLTEIRENKVLQLPLYLKAASDIILTGRSLGGGSYYSLKAMKPTTVREDDMEEIIESACAKAIWAVGRISRGYFPRDIADCRDYCDFIPLCRGKQVNKEKDTDASE